MIKHLAMRDGRSQGFYSHPLTYAEVLLMGWTVGLAGLLFEREKNRLFWPVIFLTTLGGMLCSESRGVWLSMIVLLAVWAVIRRKKRIIAMLGLLVVIGGAFFILNPKLRHRMESLHNFALDPSSNIRLGLWRDTGRSVAAHPIWGVGMGNLHLISGEGPEPRRVWTEPHNIFLQAAIEAGVVGLAAFLWILWAIGEMFWRASNGGWSDGFFFAYIGLLFAGLTESWTRDAEVVMALLFLAGSAFSIVKRKRYEEA